MSAAIESIKSRWGIKTSKLILALVTISAVLLLAFWLLNDHSAERSLMVGSTGLRLEVVDEPQSRERGLSGRQRLAEDRGMLFIFEEPDVYCFWMKDMNFPIDIVWLDADKRIVHIRENVHPGTYPERFCPDQPAQYVLEFNAGTISELDLSPRQTLTF